MEPIEPDVAVFGLPPGTRRVTYAEDQPEYRALPSLRIPDGRVVSQWLPSAEELALLLDGAAVTLVTHTFNQPLQPIILTVGGVDLR